MSVCAYVSLYVSDVCMEPLQARRGCQSSGTRVQGDYELTCGFWEMSQGAV